MSDNTNDDDNRVECTKSVAREEGVTSRVSINEHLSPPNDTTAAKCEDPTSNFDVWWSEPENEDPANPRNWSNSRKWTIIASLSLVTFLTPLASSMSAPGVPQLLADFKTDSTILATFVISIFVLGFAFGPLVIAPLSESIGRVPVYHACNVLFLIFTILCAVSKNMAMLIVFRFFAGFAGVAPITCGSGTIADLMPPERRGVAMSLWSLGPLFGPIIGPIAGGFLVEGKDWRWVFWVIAIVSGASTILCFFTLKETYPAILLERKAAQRRKETGDSSYRSRLHSDLPKKELFVRSIIRPMKMLLLSPIIFLMCSYVAIMYGLLYILFTTYTFVFEGEYGFSSGTAGLAFLGSGVGMLLGLAFAATQSDKRIRRKIALGEPILPEDRLRYAIIIPACLCLPVGLFIYGWSTKYHVHWIVPQIGNAIIGFGMIGILMCIQTYLVDAFTIHAASATAANTVLRSLLGAFFPLFGLKLYDRIGLGWGNSLLGFIALAIAPIPLGFRIFGERIRTSPKWQVKF